MRALRRCTALCAALLISLTGLALSSGTVQAATRAATQDTTQDTWTTSLHDNSRDGASADTTISAAHCPLSEQTLVAVHRRPDRLPAGHRRRGRLRRLVGRV